MIDRLLNLPAIFFRGYTVGDLGQRVMGISAIREALSRRVLIVVLAFIFSIFSLLILFYYDAGLALIAVGLAGMLMVAIFLTAYLQMRHQRDYVNLQGRFTGRTLQLINGIAKLRVAGGQRRAFVHWSDLFLRQRQALMKVQQLAVGLATFNEAHSVIILMVIFGVIAYSGDFDLGTGSFVAFLTAFTQFIVATVAVSSALSSLISIIPLYERAQPILTTLPEVSQEKHHPGELSGRIAASRVSFRYSESRPLVLDDITIEADPGEFIAIVGPSGSGKSTLLRLLLGFEVPQKGSVLYDGQDLAMLDVQSVRQQIGVVLQNGKLFTGTIFSNIVGAAPLTVDDAWDAARKAGLSEDIKAMPMRMHTVIGEGAKTISGGQKQRLLIARAIVNKPRMIIFDEATSALDNRSQTIVSQSLEELDATRIVIAHRLSTIAHADRIYVFDHGRIVQQGTYTQLVHEHGLFADLVRRQLA
jgi:ATP-binding cassette subfamily C protein